MPPLSGSMRITSAPSWAIVMPPSGAATKAENSTMRRSARSWFMASLSRKPDGAATLSARQPYRRRLRRSAPEFAALRGAGDKRAHRMRLVLDLVEPVLDQVANADDAGQPAVVEHRKVADAPVGHLGHQLGDAVFRLAGDDGRGHHL